MKSFLMNASASLGQAKPHQLQPGSRMETSLPPDLRRVAERLFEEDLSDVRITVTQLAPRIGAIAFTAGPKIYFAPGAYKPHSREGIRLLGHELAHVVQQRRGRVRNGHGYGVVVVQDDQLEAEADLAGEALQMMMMSQRSRVDEKRYCESAVSSLIGSKAIPTKGGASLETMGLAVHCSVLARYRGLVEAPQGDDVIAFKFFIYPKGIVRKHMKNYALESAEGVGEKMSEGVREKVKEEVIERVGAEVGSKVLESMGHAVPIVGAAEKLSNVFETARHGVSSAFDKAKQDVSHLTLDYGTGSLGGGVGLVTVSGNDGNSAVTQWNKLIWYPADNKTDKEWFIGLLAGYEDCIKNFESTRALMTKTRCSNKIWEVFDKAFRNPNGYATDQWTRIVWDCQQAQQQQAQQQPQQQQAQQQPQQ
ncbi:MAG: DUF4157 domain-containing protein [Myxococcota bacterium]